MEFDVHGKGDVVASIHVDGDLIIKAREGIVVLAKGGGSFYDPNVDLLDLPADVHFRKGDKVTITF